MNPERMHAEAVKEAQSAARNPRDTTLNHEATPNKSEERRMVAAIKRLEGKIQIAYGRAEKAFQALRTEFGQNEAAIRARLDDDLRSAKAEYEAVEQCKYRTSASVLEFVRCTRSAVKDGYCTRHNPKYVSRDNHDHIV